MSAQAILSALVATPPLQGAAVEVSASFVLPGSEAPAAGAFSGLLAALLGEADGDATPEGEIIADEASDETVAYGPAFQPTTLAPPPLVLLAVEGSAPASESPPVSSPAVLPEIAADAPDLAPIVAAEPSPQPAAAPIDAPAPQPTPALSRPTASLPVDSKASVNAKVTEPLVLPPAGPATAEPVVVPSEQPAAEAKAAPSIPLTTPPPVPVSTPSKALAERTAQPSETEPAPADADAAAPSASAAAGSAQAKDPPDTPTKAGDSFIVSGREPSKGGGEPSTIPAEPTAPSAAASEPAQDLSNPTALSRASIDATAQIAARIIRQLEGRSTRFEMALLPEELGRVDVKLDIDSEGRLAARLAFDNPAAATDLRGRADELRRQLEAHGFHVADDAFEFAQRDSGSHAFDRGQEQPGGRSRAFSASARLNVEAEIAAIPAGWTSRPLSPAGVDMKV